MAISIFGGQTDFTQQPVLDAGAVYLSRSKGSLWSHYQSLPAPYTCPRRGYQVLIRGFRCNQEFRRWQELQQVPTLRWCCIGGEGGTGAELSQPLQLLLPQVTPSDSWTTAAISPRTGFVTIQRLDLYDVTKLYLWPL